MSRRAQEPVRVRAYAGSRGEEEPRSVELEGVWVEIAEILDRWRDPHGRWFRVRTADGRRHLLRCSEPDLEWSLQTR